MLVKLKLRVDGETQIARGFQLAEHEARDLSRPLGEAGRIIRESVGDNFLTEGGNVGGWPKLTPDYEAWKQEHYPGMPILVRTGKLRGALLAASAVHVEPHRLIYEPDAPPYAIFHQRGTTRMKQRKIIHLTSQDRRRIDRAFQDWLTYIRRSITGSAGR